MKAVLKVVFIVLFLFIAFSCNSNPVVPLEDQPGRRDYEWTIDTLGGMQMNSLHSVWGSSSQNVWAVGPGGTENDRLWHYDGNKWSIYTKEQIWCTGATIFGFSANNVWMGGGAGWLDGPGGGIWHYDGSKWTKNFIYKVEGASIVSVNNIYGSQPNDIYACGYFYINHQIKGFVLHYDGFSWKEVVKAKNFNSPFLRIRQEQNKVYVFSYSMSSISTANDTITFYRLNGKELEEIYSNSSGNIGMGDFNLIDNKLYFCIGREVFLYKEENFIKQFSINDANFDYFLFGRNSKDIFLCMQGGVAHYNGDNIQYVLSYPRGQSLMGEGILFDKELFWGLVDFSSNKNFVLHGKLKN